MSAHPSFPIARCSWQALGTSVVLALTDGRLLAEAREAVQCELEAIDGACSRFRPDSDLQRVNAGAGRPVKVDPLLLEAVELALRAARLTDGDVDPSLGVALELAGYDRDWQLIEAAQRASQAPLGRSADALRGSGEPWIAPRLKVWRRPGWQGVELDWARQTVKVPSGVKLDLGATAKAWAADRACGAAQRVSGAGVLVGLGGDLSVQGPVPTGGWQVHVTDDHRAGPQAPGQRVRIAAGGLATSSVVVRRWRREGTQMHHLIDPSSGAPTRGPWRTVSVAAGNCADANIASTAAIVRGERAPAWLESLGLPARLVAHDDTVLTVAGWPAETPQAPVQKPEQVAA
jgi:thiamine biosynthesis lipoprotein ApbE